MQVERTPFEHIPFWRSSLMRGEWRDLVFINYTVDPSQLVPHVPRGVDLDLWQGKALVSLVALQFRNPRVLGIAIAKEEVTTQINFRFYVREGQRRGVVFLTEHAPRTLMLLGARGLYHEPFLLARTSGSSAFQADELAIEYTLSLGTNTSPNLLSVHAGLLPPAPVRPDTEQYFIAHRPYGYSRSIWGDTTRYGVSHDPWRVRAVTRSVIRWDFAGIHGPQWKDLGSRTPHSVFVAEGSKVYLSLPERL